MGNGVSPTTIEYALSVTDAQDTPREVLPIIKGQVKGNKCNFLVDSGATINLIEEKYVRLLKDPDIHPCFIQVQGISDTVIPINEFINVDIYLDSQSFKVKFFICSGKIGLGYGAILGSEFLHSFDVVIDYSINTIYGSNFYVEWDKCKNKNSFKVGKVEKLAKCSGVLISKQTLPPLSESFVQIKLKGKSLESKVVLFEHSVDLKNDNIMVARGIYNLDKTNKYLVKILNSSQERIHLNKGLKLIEAEPLMVASSEKVNNLSCLDSQIEDSFEAWGGDFDLSHISDQHKTPLIDLLNRYSFLFARSVKDLVGCDTIEHEIHLTDSVPVRVKPYKTPIHLRSEMDKQIAQLLDAEIIQESTSPYSAPVLLVKKADNSYRLVTDFRKLNLKTIPDNFPLPQMLDLVENLSGCNLFSTLDLTSGYYQMKLREEDKIKCGFSTQTGHYHWNRMPFGLRNAPSSFQRLMSLVLSNLQPLQIGIYIDDIVLASATVEEHLDKLKIVFDRLADHNLKIKPSKCHFMKDTVKYLGFKVSKGIVSPDPSNLELLQKFNIPKNRKQVRQYLGLAGFYRRFIHNYAQKALPLTNLTKDNLAFTWGTAEQQAFETLKTELVKEPILKLPVMSKEFVLCTDASNYALGSVLCQDYEGFLHPVAYASRKLKDAEVRYSTFEKEALGIVWATAYFRQYLVGKHFTIYCDQASLSQILKLKDSTSRIARWITALSQFDYTVIHKPGKLNVTADYLSRAVNTVNLVQHSVEPILYENIAEQQLTDDKCLKIKGMLESNISPNPKTLKFFCEDNVLFCTHSNPKHRWQSNKRILVPLNLRTKVMELHHDSPVAAHCGFGRTLSKIQKSFYWPSMYSQIRNYVSSCHECLRRRGFQPSKKAPLGRLPVTSRPLERIAMDIVGPLPITLANNKYILVMTDYFTRYPEAYPLPDTKSHTVAGALEKFIATHGVPEQLISDRATNFLSDCLKEVYRVLQIEKINTSAYHPQTDGVLERLNATLINSLKYLVNDSQDDWDSLLPFALLAHRSARHSATGETPAYLLYGRDLTLPCDLLLKKDFRSYADTLSYSQDMCSRLKTSFDVVRKNLTLAADKQEEFRLKTAVDKHIKIGDSVYLFTPVLKEGQVKKFTCFNRGPYRVIGQAKNKVNYQLMLLNKPSKVMWVHVDRLTRIPDRILMPSLDVNLQQSVDSEETRIKEVDDDSNGTTYNLRPRESGFVVSP